MKLKKLGSMFLIASLLLTGCQSVKGEDEGNTAKEVVEEVKVVAATVSATQVLDKLDATLLGIPTTKMKIPEQYVGLPEVGQSMSPDLEIVASLEPDLFIMDKMFKDSVEESMKQYDLNTYFFDTTNYTSFVNSIEELGGLINKEEEAKNLISELKSSVEDATSNKKDGEEPTVAILFGGGENFMLATDSSYLGDLTKTVGAKNIVNELDSQVESAYIPFSLEQILAQNPDYVLRFAHGNIEETKKAFDDAFDKNPAWQELDAYQNGKVIDLDPSIFNVSANLQIKEAIETLGEIFYGK